MSGSAACGLASRQMHRGEIEGVDRDQLMVVAERGTCDRQCRLERVCRLGVAALLAQQP